MTDPKQLVVYVDIDDTLVRTVGSHRIPMTEMVLHVHDLHRSGVILYAWSSGGGEYARAAARELDIEDCFTGFLPKPNVIIDDQSPVQWRRLVYVHPGEATATTLAEYVDAVDQVTG